MTAGKKRALYEDAAIQDDERPRKAQKRTSEMEVSDTAMEDVSVESALHLLLMPPDVHVGHSQSICVVSHLFPASATQLC